MDFIQYLINRQSMRKEGRKIGEVSANQYNNRLDNLKKRGIYNGEDHLTEDMILQINDIYANKTSEYERTINYYIEYKHYLENH
ncbi:hypothetical protein ACFP7A_13055 [Sporolactobacillus kofuensis]|uniref:YozE SAM-like domain-containing protein n=1 Tax=Sporolactobacillus kofuensis TaxID=269672 RepID=A0ABW1WJX6_9BACL|nr:hypothetical protein [Sporolactobacillus kofuensis]MCO7176978.1 hypothetical protein [Sporolactobacillus kofuensis]